MQGLFCMLLVFQRRRCFQRVFQRVIVIALDGGSHSCLETAACRPAWYPGMHVLLPLTAVQVHACRDSKICTACLAVVSPCVACDPQGAMERDACGALCDERFGVLLSAFANASTGCFPALKVPAL